MGCVRKGAAKQSLLRWRAHGQEGGRRIRRRAGARWRRSASPAQAGTGRDPRKPVSLAVSAQLRTVVLQLSQPTSKASGAATLLSQHSSAAVQHLINGRQHFPA